MALVNILAKSNRQLNWKKLLVDYSSLNLTEIEIFPIPKELGFDQDAIGICIHHGYSNKKTVILDMESLIAFFSSENYNLKFIELYEGIEVLPENVGELIYNLLP